MKAVKTFDTMLRDMDAVLADNEWLAGATFSLADIAVIPYVNRMELFTMLSPWPPERPRVMTRSEVFPRNNLVDLHQRGVLGVQPRIPIRDVKKAHLAHRWFP